MKRLTAASALCLLLAACATGPQFSTENVNTGLSPGEAKQRPEALSGERVIWGGAVLASRNLEQNTLLEVLAYPLDEYNQRPQADESPLGRILVRRAGYLETADYEQGRLVTVTGRFTGLREGRVGQAPYVYPVVEADDIYLWSREYRSSYPRFHFGVGVIFGN